MVMLFSITIWDKFDIKKGRKKERVYWDEGEKNMRMKKKWRENRGVEHKRDGFRKLGKVKNGGRKSRKIGRYHANIHLILIVFSSSSSFLSPQSLNSRVLVKKHVQYNMHLKSCSSI